MTQITTKGRNLANELSGPKTGLVSPSAMSLLCRKAVAYSRLQVERCNGDRMEAMGWEKWDKWLGKSEDRLEGQIRAIVAEFLPDHTVTFEGDPRGCTVRIVRPDGRGNTMDGNWGVEGS